MAYYDNYEKDKDYYSLMMDAIANDDWESAAVYEQQRNAKIDGEGLNYEKTNKLSEYLPGGSTNQKSDYTQIGKQADQFDSMIAQLMQRISSRQPFSYDPETDPMYQLYKEQYTKNGERAMKDTLAEVSSRTGGLASSYAEQASQQAYDNSMQQLDAIIPELRSLAYEMYQGDIDRDLETLNLYRGMESDAYSRREAEKANAQGLIEKYLGAGVSAANLPPELVELSGFDPAYLAALEGQFTAKNTGRSKVVSGPSVIDNGTGKWDDVDAWVEQYGADSAEQYIKEHYRDLGYKTASEALAGYQNHRLEAGIFDSTYDELYALADRAGLDAKPLTEEMFDKYYAGSARNYDEYLQNWRTQMLGGSDNAGGSAFNDSREYQSIMSKIDGGKYNITSIQTMIENADIDEATKEYLYKHALEKYS